MRTNRTRELNRLQSICMKEKETLKQAREKLTLFGVSSYDHYDLHSFFTWWEKKLRGMEEDLNRKLEKEKRNLILARTGGWADLRIGTIQMTCTACGHYWEPKENVSIGKTPDGDPIFKSFPCVNEECDSILTLSSSAKDGGEG